MKKTEQHSVSGVALAALMFFSLPNGLAAQRPMPHQAMGPKIRAISGAVVDALTGKPVPGIDVILRVRSFNEQFRYENCRTSADGRFGFPASVASSLAGLGSSLEVSLSVNKVFLSADQLRAASNEQWRVSDGVSDVSWLAMSATLPDEPKPRRGRGEPPPSLNNKAYFPMSAQFLKDCNELWNATCIVPDSFSDVLIPLIPVLTDPSECKKIGDPDLSDRCRQLNTFRAAFGQVDTMAQVRTAKAKCGNVDYGRVSENCLQNLHAYIRSEHSAPNHPFLLPEYEPVEKALILVPVGGMSPSHPTLDSPDPFAETVSYSVRYSPPRGVFPRDVTAHVSVWLAKADEWRASILAPFFMAKEEEVRDPMAANILDGNPITTLELISPNGRDGWRGGSRIYLAYWLSGEKTIVIRFDYGDAEGPTPEQAARDRAATLAIRRELIRAYLRKYPSSN